MNFVKPAWNDEAQFGTLAKRAQCYLLLGEPENALRELTTMHRLCRVLESRPTSQPMTLVAAMISKAWCRPNIS